MPRAPLAALSLANFVTGTAILIVAGLLNELAADLRVSIAAAGQLFTASSLVICVGAPVLAGLTSRFDRRKLLAGILAALALLHFAAAAAPNLGALLALRALIGLCAAIITPQAAATAGLLVPATARGKAISLVFLGFALSTVLGLPLGTWLGATFGWRFALALIGVLAALAASVLWFAVPSGLRVAPMDRSAWRELAGNAALLLIIATTVLQATGQFVLYSYIAPALRDSLAATPALIALLLLWLGASGVAGMLVAGQFVDRAGSPRIVLAGLGLMLAAMLLWPAAHGSLAATAAVLLLWGLGGFPVNMSQQARLAGSAPHLATASIALNSSAIYLGQALGAMIGASVISLAGIGDLGGYAALSFAAAIFVSMRVREAGVR